MNNNNSTKSTKKRYSTQFKDQAVDRSEKDGVQQAARDLDISASLLYSWRTKKSQGGDSLENQKLQQAELARLKRECSRLTEENAFLKKAAAYFAKENK